MKKWFLVLAILIFSLSAYGADIKYKNIKNGAKIYFNADTQRWSSNPNKNSDYLIKTNNMYMSKDGVKDYYTDCDYDFIYNGKLIGYSNYDLNFYEFTMENNNFKENVLTREEVQFLFPEYKIINLSEFSDKTHSYKLKKNGDSRKIILYNDVDGKFADYYFSSGNADFDTYPLRGFINISRGMIQFSSKDEENSPWYVLLVR